MQALPGGQAVLALEVVDARHAARVGLLQAAGERLVEHVLRRQRNGRGGMPRRPSRATRP